MSLFIFYLYLIFYACIRKFDVTGTVGKFLENKQRHQGASYCTGGCLGDRVLAKESQDIEREGNVVHQLKNSISAMSQLVVHAFTLFSWLWLVTSAYLLEEKNTVDWLPADADLL